MSELTKALDVIENLEATTAKETTPTEEIIHQNSALEIIVREDRHRQKFNRKTLNELMDSIREVGQIQPGVCTINPEGQLELLVGERRLRACMVLQIPFKYWLKEEVKNPLLLEQIQLDENLCREDLDWKEEITAKARLHTILTQLGGQARSGVLGGHSLAMTADHIGVKKSILQEDVTLAGFLEVPEIAAAANKTTAKKIAKRMIEQVKRQETLSTVLSTAKAQGPVVQAPLTEKARAQQKAEARGGKPPGGRPRTVLEEQLIYYSKRCILGRMEEKLLAFKDESFDIVCFDPPWGVEFDKVRKSGGGTKNYIDEPAFFFEKIAEWLELIYRKMKPNSHLYMFFGMGTTPEGEFCEEAELNPEEGLRYRDHIYNLLYQIGFNTNRIPLIWYKKGAHVTRNPTIWPGRSYEPIAYARKGSKPLAKQGLPDMIQTPMPTPSLKDIHPSAKHPQIYRELLLRSAQPADTLLDPMAGSGMFGVAAESLQKTHALNWFQIEVDADYRNLELMNLTKGYEVICGEEAQGPEAQPFLRSSYPEYTPPPLAEDFKTLQPGTEDWKRYWQAHPDQQDAMLEWRKENSK